MKNIPTSLLTLTAGIVITLISLWYGQHHGLLPEQASLQAPLVDGLFNLMVTISTALFIVVIGAMLIFVVQFRQRPGDEGDGLPIEGNLPLEAFWTALPAMILIVLGIYTVQVFEKMGGFNPGDHAGHMMAHHQHHAADQMIAQAGMGDTAPGEGVAVKTTNIPVYGYGPGPERKGKTADVIVNVTGMQYAWLFNYPGSNIIAGELHVPVGKEVQLKLSAKDVIHSFWVPQFRLKQDAIPGEDTELRFTATKIGEYPVVCAELCGGYHGSMRTKVIVHSPDDYDQWLQQNTQVAQVSAPAPANSIAATSIAATSTTATGTPVALSSDQLAEFGATPQRLPQLLSQVH
jgi:cytochrome c oxidase subunit II